MTDSQIVSEILAEWNPIGVPEVVADSEYTSYVHRLLPYQSDISGLIIEMERIVTDSIGIDYDADNPEHKQHTGRFATKIIQALKDNAQGMGAV